MLAPALSLMVNGCRVVVAVNCSVRVNSSCTGRPQFQRRERHDVLGEDLLFAAEAAADPAGDHPDWSSGRPKTRPRVRRTRNGTWLEVRT